MFKERYDNKHPLVCCEHGKIVNAPQLSMHPKGHIWINNPNLINQFLGVIKDEKWQKYVFAPSIFRPVSVRKAAISSMHSFSPHSFLFT
jgi:hypothetical protein